MGKTGSAASFRYLSRTGLGLLLFPLVGCDLAEGLGDVGDSLTSPDAALLDSPGRKLAAGQYHRLLIDGSLDDGGHVIALRTIDEGTEAAIIPYLEGDGCTITPATAFERLSSRVDVDLPGVISVQRNTDSTGRGTIDFVDFDCKTVIESIPDASLPQIAFPAASPEGLLALTLQGDLYQVNAVHQRLDSIANEVTIARTDTDRLWTIENGELVLRDVEYRELERFGTGVTEFTLPGGTVLQVAFMDENGLSVWNEDDGVTLVSETACGPTSWGLDVVAYYDPCETQKLHVYTLGGRLGLEEEFVHIEGPEGAVDLVSSLVVFGQGHRTSEFMFLAAGPSGNQLMLGTIDAEPEVMDGTVQMESVVIADNNATIRSGVPYTDWDGVSGTLMDRERDEEGTTVGVIAVAPGVASLPGGTPYSLAGALTNFDGTTGTLEVLIRTGDDIESQLIADRVPLQTQSVEAETGRRAFIGDSDDGIVGALYLSNEPNSGRLTYRKIGEYAHIDTARFLEQPRGVAYLARRPGNQYASLEVYLLDSELTVTVHQRVSEYRTVPWPAPGILYAVPSGDDAGLWFSKAR